MGLGGSAAQESGLVWCTEQGHGTGPPTWLCFLPWTVDPVLSPASMRPGGQDPALPGNECPRCLVSPGAHGWGGGRDHLHSVFGGQEIPTGRVTSC